MAMGWDPWHCKTSNKNSRFCNILAYISHSSYGNPFCLFRPFLNTYLSNTACKKRLFYTPAMECCLSCSSCKVLNNYTNMDMVLSVFHTGSQQSISIACFMDNIITFLYQELLVVWLKYSIMNYSCYFHLW